MLQLSVFSEGIILAVTLIRPVSLRRMVKNRKRKKYNDEDMVSAVNAVEKKRNDHLFCCSKV